MYKHNLLKDYKKKKKKTFSISRKSKTTNLHWWLFEQRVEYNY